MTKRVIIGKRGTSYGIWSAPIGKDAETGADSDLSFLMTNKYEQIALIGSSAGSIPIPFSFSLTPNVLLIGVQGDGSFTRPYPNLLTAQGSAVSAVMSSTYFTLSAFSWYVVFRRNF